jgi:Bacteriophage, scaffolding protein.
MTVAENDGADSGQDNTNIDAEDGQNTGATPGDGTAGGEGGEVDDGEVTITIEGAAPPSEEDEDLDGPGLVNKLRRMNRDKERELRELRQKSAAPAQEVKAETVAKPTLAGCEYDEDAYESKLTAWHDQQAKIKAEQQSKADAEKQATEAWQAALANHDKAKAALKVPDYEEAEEVISGLLSVTQRAIIVDGADNSARLEYALGKNPAKAKELASIKNPVKFAFAVAKLETLLKDTPRKAPPPPERQVRGTSAVAVGSDVELERLRADAAKTGDLSKVLAYKKQKRAA